MTSKSMGRQRRIPLHCNIGSDIGDRRPEYRKEVLDFLTLFLWIPRTPPPPQKRSTVPDGHLVNL